MVIVAGNQRYHAAVSLKMKTVPVFILPESITPEEIDQISLLDNHNNGQWDYDKLFETYDGDYLQDIGFTDKELGLIDDVRIVFAQDKYVDNTIEDVAETEFQHDKRKEIEDEANRIAKERYENEKAKIERETKEKLTIDDISDELKKEIIKTTRKEVLESKKEILETPIPELSTKSEYCKEKDIYEFVVNNKTYKLMCGDSTNQDDVDKLMDCKAELLFTSPPYSAMREYVGEKQKDLSMDYLCRFIDTFRIHANYQVVNLGLTYKDNEVIPYWNIYLDMAKSVGLKLLSWNVWDKVNCGTLASQNKMFGLQHEWLFVFGDNPKDLIRTVPNDIENYERKHSIDIGENTYGKSIGKGDKSIKHITNTYTHKQLSTVLRTTNTQYSYGVNHPAKFPLNLPYEYILAMTKPNDVVVDCFMGSGTTMIACLESERNCYGMELEPIYVELIIKRMIDNCNKKNLEYKLYRNEKEFLPK